MSAIYLLIPVSLLVASGFLVAFIWAVRSGQYEDTQTPALRVLTEEPPGATCSRFNKQTTSLHHP